MRCPMDEKRGSDILIEYCSGTLAPEKAVAVDQHSAECPACSEFIARQRAVWSALDSWTVEPVSADFDHRLFARIEGEQSQTWPARLAEWIEARWKPLIPLGVMACIAVLLLVQVPAPSPTPVELVDVNQVQQTLDDLDMLRQLGPPATAGTASL